MGLQRRADIKKLLLAGAAVCGLLQGPAASSDEDSQDRSQLSELLGSDHDAGFAKAVEPRSFGFPDDHGPHPEYRNEWWYVTGNLEADSGRRFGFELTIFRFALAPGVPQADSAWRSNQVYIAHFALTDANREVFRVAQRFSRGALGLAGAQADPFRVWIDDWQMAAARRHGGASPADNREHWHLRATDDEFAIDLELFADKPPVLNGIDGLSRKSAELGNASYYYSITRWRTAGKVRIDRDEFAVTGLSWLDREWSSSALADDQSGWDWYALQLTDGSELMFYNLRKTDGSQDEYSAGTWISAEGSGHHVRRDEITISVIDTWQSPEGGRYPSQWRIELPGYGALLNIEPVMADQELLTTVRYWEGAVNVSGERDGAPVNGRGYVELTGYAD